MLLQSVFSTALLCATAFASPVVEKRDAAPINNALASISTAVQGLTAQINSWTGDQAAATTILTNADGILGVIKKATAAITPTSNLPLLEATQVLTPGNALIADVQKVTTALISKKDGFVKQNLGPTIGQVLGKFKVEANNLILAIKSKLPANVAVVGDNIGQQINAALDKGTAAFN